MIFARYRSRTGKTHFARVHGSGSVRISVTLCGKLTARPGWKYTEGSADCERCLKAAA